MSAPPTRRTGIIPVLAGAWGLLLAGALLAPGLLPSADPGDELTRNTVRLALLYYLLATLLMLRLDGDGWRVSTLSGRGARLCWSLAWLAYAIHVGMAFHHHHRWSHREAYLHVERVSGFGPGVFVSYLFTLAWTADVAWWWARPVGYASRPAWIGGCLHAFLAFVVFNGTVVYETGLIRWAGLALFMVLGSSLVVRGLTPSCPTAHTTATRPR
jgi:hypothetical protein